nr:protein SIEVE ELEMENT OCCLUSION B-like [Ipomoea batatas]
MAAQTPLVSQRIISQPTMMLTSLSSQSVDESIIREQVLSTHNYDGREFDTNFILSMAEKTINLETGTAQKVMVEELNQLEELDTYKELSLHIRQLSFEIASSAIAKNQHYSTTIHHLLSIVSPYCWEDKLVLMIAAFSIIHGGEFSLISRLCKGKGKGLALKQTTAEDYWCISSAIELTKCVVQLKQCLSYSPPQSLILALPMAAYWIATTVVNCASYAYACDPHFKLQNEHREITTLMATFSAELARKKNEESYNALRNALYHGSSDKLEVFKLMFNVNDDDEIIFHHKDLRFWKRGLVMLLITSGVGVPKEWIRFLNWFRYYSRPHIIWIPITQDDASWSTEYEQQCDKLRKKIRFFWLNDPKEMLRSQFTRFVKEELFQKGWGEEPIIVSLDQRGRIVHQNAIHMMLTWTHEYIEQNTIGVKVIPHDITLFIQNELKQGIYGIEASTESSNFLPNVGPKIDSMTTDLVHNIADKINAWKKDVEAIIEEMTAQSTPYDSEKEKLLWQQQTWTLHLLAPQSGHCCHYYRIGMPINDWIRKEKYIFLYGGNNIKWIREFLCKVREVASKTQMNFEFAYIGKNKMVRETIAKERMSHCALLNSNGVWWFWARLQSKNATTEGWVLLSKGSEVVVCGHGSKMLQAMNDYEIWKENIAATKGFDQAFKDYHEMLSKDKHSCCTLEYPITLSKIPENERCPECSRRMQKFLTFTCCHDHNVEYDSDE